MGNQRVMAVCNAVYRTDVAPAKRMVLLMLLDLSCIFVFIPVKAKLMPRNWEQGAPRSWLETRLLSPHKFFPSRKLPFWVTRKGWKTMPNSLCEEKNVLEVVQLRLMLIKTTVRCECVGFESESIWCATPWPRIAWFPWTRKRDITRCCCCFYSGHNGTSSPWSYDPEIFHHWTFLTWRFLVMSRSFDTNGIDDC